MVIEEFDKVKLKTGEIAYIADILKAGIAYVVDVDKSDGSIETRIIEKTDIEKVLKDGN